MTFQRRILHHGATPTGTPQLLSLAAVRGCWFELHRQGGCGSGELRLSENFEQRDLIELGDWISLEGNPGDRWYLGRVEERRAEVPAGVRLRLEGMAIELNQIFPGGFGSDVDGAKPHVYAATDLFGLDPDEDIQTFDWIESADELVRLFMTQSLPATSHIQYLSTRVETPVLPAPVTSLKMRGEESLRALLKDLALRAQSAAWGVDEQGEFFFLRPRNGVLAAFQDQQDLTALAESRDLELVFNRILLTGDYVYDRFDHSDDVARRSYRWRGNYTEPVSRAQYGDRRIRVWLPWVRTQSDAVSFAREFFRAYSQPHSQYFVETTAQTTLPRPWLGRVQLNDRFGNPLIVSRVETLRVLFDHVPRLRMELGPENPSVLWPEPPQDDRWELPNIAPQAGGDVSVPPLPGGGGAGGGGSGGAGGGTSTDDPDLSSALSSDGSGDESDGSDGSLDGSGEDTTLVDGESSDGGDTESGEASSDDDGESDDDAPSTDESDGDDDSTDESDGGDSDEEEDSTDDGDTNGNSTTGDTSDADLSSDEGGDSATTSEWEH
ncbi:hypothetical protein [Planctomicrobium piriforme]|uniref:Virus ReqiPepy6 Gp37-like protein n=1 Tax=Planctomicrobium piriforme TaxID=1576369 RepID=A0A1I3C258_9PLAN|nr:hypothetical protein [Planctomicrobium piriforme]SFH68406.1 hypothetical protein SAMN05421753_10245 [Planctomicrobium piriforme]